MKKKFLSAAAVILAFVMLFSFGVFADSADNVKYIAHRGFSGAAPENTIAAARLSGENGYYGCEFDIWPTSDRVWVVMHDETVDRMTDGEGSISDMTLEQVKALKIDAGSNIENYPDEKVPTLNEMLAACDESGIRPIIEIKNGDKQNLESLASQLNESGLIGKCTVISFVPECLTGMRELCPELELWYLVKTATDKDIDFCLENSIQGIDCDHYGNTGLNYRKLRESGLVMGVWTVEKPQYAAGLADEGFTYITTNSLNADKVSGVSGAKVKGSMFFLKIRAFFTKIGNFISDLFKK